MRKLDNEELDRLSLNEYKEAKKLPLTIILDNIRSMHNIGSVFRTADAFLIEKICLCGLTAVPPRNEIRKTALGATDSVRWEYFKKTSDSIQLLRSKGYSIIAVEQTTNSTSLELFKPKSSFKYAIIFGHEVRGIEQEIIDQSDISLEVPQFGTKHSLNISVCAGIVSWHFFKALGFETK